jgi:hypothetical protein
MSRLKRSVRTWTTVSLFFLWGLGVVALCGCSGGTGKLHTVEGKALVDGTALTEGTVVFYPVEPKKALDIKGEIGSDGTYKMTTNGKPGVPAGKYKVVVNTVVAKATTDVIPTTPTGVAPPPKSKVNARFEDPTQTPLTVEVPQGPFDLKMTLQ